MKKGNESFKVVMEDFLFERRKYEGADITPEVMKHLADRITRQGEHVLKYVEIPVCSVETIEIMFSRTTELLASFDKCVLLIDVTSTDVPDAEVRRTINEGFKDICDLVEHVAFVSGKKYFFNTLLKFIMFQTNLESYSIYETEEEANEGIIKVLGSG